jgi:tetratricopeptide (TPR) repeat protein
MNPSSSKTKLSSEVSYREGNLHYSQGNSTAAEQSWKNSSLKQETETKQSGRKNNAGRPPFFRTIAAVVLTAVCFYTIIFSFFQREPDALSEWMLSQQQQQHRSFWDNWWDTGRPSISFNRTPFGTEDWLQQFRENLRELMEQENPERSVSRQEFEKWLERKKKNSGLQKPTNHYVLTGRGLFNVRKFDEAIATYQEGLHYAESPEHFGELFRELGTAYYYKGYQLQADGLAKYDLKLVNNSIESYLQAEKFTSGPYLYGNMGWGFYLLEDFEKSVEYSERALVLDPTLVYVRMNLGISYLHMDEYSKAFLAYQSIRSFEPEFEEYDGGIRDLKELKIKYPSGYPFTDFILGFILMEQGRFHDSRNALLSFVNSSFAGSSWKLKAQEMIRMMAGG